MKERKKVKAKRRRTLEAEAGVMHLEMKEGYKSRSVGTSGGWKNQANESPQKLQRGHSPAHTLILGPTLGF